MWRRREFCRFFIYFHTNFIVPPWYISNNIVELHLYLQTNGIQMTTEVPDYPFANLLSDLGGVIGLYLGMTVISLVEFSELVIFLVYVYIKRAIGCVDYKQDITQEV